jgi:hypothetical protein
MISNSLLALPTLIADFKSSGLQARLEVQNRILNQGIYPDKGPQSQVLKHRV